MAGPFSRLFPSRFPPRDFSIIFVFAFPAVMFTFEDVFFETTPFIFGKMGSAIEGLFSLLFSSFELGLDECSSV